MQAAANLDLVGRFDVYRRNVILEEAGHPVLRVTGDLAACHQQALYVSMA